MIPRMTLPSLVRAAPGQPPRKAPRRFALAVAGAALLLAGGCGRNQTKADAYEALADSMMTNGAYPAAIGALSAATALDSNEARRWVKLGRAHRALDNSAQSAMAYQRALDLDPANVEALQAMSVLLVRAGRYEDAKRYSQPLLVLSPDDVGGLLAEGAIAYFEGNLSRADQLATRLVALAPDLADGHILQARILQARGKPREATALLLQREKLDPDSIAYAVQLMETYRQNGDLGGIRGQATILARLLPDNVTYLMESARAYWADGQRDRAGKIIDGLATRYRNSPSMLSTIADFWRGALPEDQAIARIVALGEKSSGRTRAALGDALVDAGAVPAAIRLLAPVADQPIGGDTVDLHTAYASALLAAGRAADARKQLDAVLAFDGGNGGALLVRARERLARRDYDNALTDAQLVTAGDPENEEAALLIPAIYTAKGQLALAGRAFGEAQQDQPDNIRILRARVAWLTTHGHSDDAFQLAAQFARSHQHTPGAWALVRQACTAAGRDDCERLARPTQAGIPPI